MSWAAGQWDWSCLQPVFSSNCWVWPISYSFVKKILKISELIVCVVMSYDVFYRYCIREKVLVLIAF
jgi:hypothetical protein